MKKRRTKFETFKKQIESKFTNEPRKESKRIEELESESTMLQNQILETKK